MQAGEFASVFPRTVALVQREIGDYTSGLFDCEREVIRSSVLKRRMEFSTGRVSARTALSILGVTPQPIPVGASREPVFPRGTTGSISHDCGTCVSVAAVSDCMVGLGVDVTSTKPLEAALRRLVCTGAETDAFRDKHEICDPHKLAFSAKEAFYKAAWRILKRFVDFHEVRIDIDFCAGTWKPEWVDGCCKELRGCRIEGRFRTVDDVLFTGAWISAR